jgi:nucleoside-diphosphate-sugar epimerase
MKILLTGISGFIGSYFMKKWAQGPNEIIGISRTARPGDVSARMICHDLADPIPLNEKVDVIVHTAAQGPGPHIRVQDFINNNILATKTLIDYARQFKIPRIIYLSTVSVYGQVHDKKIDAHTPIINPDGYGLTKLMGEMLLHDESERIDSIVLRLPGVLGRQAKGIWLANVAQKLLKNQDVHIFNPDGMFNNMIHVSDLEKFILKLMSTHWTGTKKMTLGNTESITIRNAVETLKNCLGSKSKIKAIRSDDPLFSICTDTAAGFGYQSMGAVETLKRYSRELLHP